jgi:hypothetical protein
MIPSLTDDPNCWLILKERIEPYRSNPKDTTLVELIDLICLHADCPDQQEKAKVALGLYIADLPHFQRIAERDLPLERFRQEVLEKFAVWVANSIHNFKPTGTSASSSLSYWLHKRLTGIIKDHFKILTKLELYYTEISTNTPCGNDEGSPIIEDTLATPTLSGLDALIAEEQNHVQEQRSKSMPLPLANHWIEAAPQELLRCFPHLRFDQYITKDPHQYLQSKFYRKSQCNYQYLAGHLIQPLLNGKKATETQVIVDEFHNQIPYTALYRHINDNFMPYVNALYLEILLPEEWEHLGNCLQQYCKEELTALYYRQKVNCNAFFLAERLLVCFTPCPKNWSEIVAELQGLGWSGANKKNVKKHWQEDCLPYIGRVAQRFFEYVEAK